MRQWLYIYLGLMAYCLGCLIVVNKAFKGRNMKNKIRIAGAILAILLAGFAVAEEVKDYHVQIEPASRAPFTDAFKIKPSDAPNGIYIVAISGWSSTYPNVANIVKDKFRAHGFVVTENIENADLGLSISTIGMPIEDVETNVTHINKEFVAGQVGAAILTGGISLIASGMHLTGKAKGIGTIAGTVSKGPLKLTGRKRIDSDKVLYQAMIGSKFAADETNAMVHTQLFNTVLDSFMTEYTMKAEPVAAVAPVEPAVASVKPQ